jgi:hypothetical protein
MHNDLQGNILCNFEFFSGAPEYTSIYIHRLSKYLYSCTYRIPTMICVWLRNSSICGMQDCALASCVDGVFENHLIIFVLRGYFVSNRI